MLKKLLTTIKHYRQAIKYRKWYNKAAEESNRLHTRIYAVKINGKPVLLTRGALKSLRSKGILPKTFTAIDLRKISLFVVDPTPTKK